MTIIMVNITNALITYSYQKKVELLLLTLNQTSNNEDDSTFANWICCIKIKLGSLKATLLSYHDLIYQ